MVFFRTPILTRPKSLVMRLRELVYIKSKNGHNAKLIEAEGYGATEDYF